VLKNGTFRKKAGGAMFFVMQVSVGAPVAKQNKVMKVLTFGGRFHPIKKIREIRAEIRAAKRAVRDNWQLLENYDNLARAEKNTKDAMERAGKTEKLVEGVPEEYADFAGLYKDVQTINLGFATAFAKTCVNEAKKVVAALSEKTVKLALKYSAFTIAQKALNVIAVAAGITAVIVAIIVDASFWNASITISAGAGLSLAIFMMGAAIKNFGEVRSKYYKAAEIYKKAKNDAARDKGSTDFTEG
jgi:hypothetical protein